MKELRGLERRIRLCECIHLALITPCISLVMALFVKEENELVWLLMALGAIIPVQLIRFICDRVGNPVKKALLSLAVAAAASLLTLRRYYWMCYLACCIPILLSGLILPRQKNRLIFTTPTLIALLPMILIYALGRVYPKPLLCVVSVVQAALVTLNYFLYMNQTRLLEDISTAVIGMKANVSVTGMIRHNREFFMGFLLLAALILVAVPLLMQPREQEKHEPLPESTGSAEPEETPEPEPPEEKNYRESPDGKPLNIEQILDYGPYIIAFLIPAGGVVGFIALIWMLITSITKRKDGPLEVEDGMTVERLKPERVPREKERLYGYEKKIRRGYEKLIKARVPGKTPLAAKTPTELEQAAELGGDSAETIHTIYCLTRYSGEPVTKESYAAFKEAVRTVSAQQDAKDDPNPQE